MFRQTRPIVARHDVLLRQWERPCADLLHPDVELTVETFAALLSAYKQLAAAGHGFEFGTVALMTTLERQAVESIDTLEDETDGDRDRFGLQRVDANWRRASSARRIRSR